MQVNIAIVLTEDKSYDKVFIAESVVSDDDWTMKSLLKHIFQDIKSHNPRFVYLLE